MTVPKLVDVQLDEQVVADLDQFAAVLGRVYWTSPTRSDALRCLLRNAPPPRQPNHFHGPSSNWPTEEEEEATTER